MQKKQHPNVTDQTQRKGWIVKFSSKKSQFQWPRHAKPRKSVLVYSKRWKMVEKKTHTEIKMCLRKVCSETKTERET